MAPVEVGHKGVPPAPVRGVPVEEGKEGVVRDRLGLYTQPVAAFQLPARRGGELSGEHDE